jgi:hypothetical protein
VEAHGLPAFDTIAGGVPGLVPDPRVRTLSDTRIDAGIRGLDSIERKAAGRWASRPKTGKVNSLAPLWVSVPFAVVFVLGCLTLV